MVGTFRAELAGLSARVTRDLLFRRTIDQALNDILQRLADTFTQTGKTEMILDVAGQRLDQRPAPILYVGPNKQFLSEQFEPRVMALLDEAPTLTAKLARGKRMTKTRKVVGGVPFRLAHAGSSTALKSDPAALALVDEYDEMKSNVNQQGGPLGFWSSGAAIPMPTSFAW
jgi:phage terminase large subunit GpA-like protein